MAVAALFLVGLAVPATATSAAAGTNGCPPAGEFWGIAHQGAHDKENGITTYRNTLPAFKRAQDRCQLVESDVRFTSDGIAVMVHDQSTYPMFRGRCDLVVAEHTLAEIQKACRNPDGSTVATFAQYLDIADRQGFVEVKPGNVSATKIKKLVTAVYYAGDADVVSLMSTDTMVLDRIAALDDDSNPISRVWKGALIAYPDEVARVCDYAIYNVKKFTSASVSTLESRGVQSISSLTSDIATWDRLASTGAYGTLTDYSLEMFNWQNNR
jgi:glycerophosphoryl diester phosphodiesterase